MGFVFLYKRPRETLNPFCHTKNSKDMVLKEERTLTDPGLIGTFILNSPASRTVKKYIFVGDEPSVWLLTGPGLISAFPPWVILPICTGEG